MSSNISEKQMDSVLGDRANRCLAAFCREISIQPPFVSRRKALLRLGGGFACNTTALLVLGALFCARLTSAQGINYAYTKGFSFRNNQGNGITLTGIYFDHAIDPTGTIGDVVPAGQNPGFNVLASEDTFYRQDPDGVRLSIINGSGPQARNIKFGTTPLGLGPTTFMAQAGTANANTTFLVSTLTNQLANGSVNVAGTAPMGRYAFSYGAISATTKGTRLTGRVLINGNARLSKAAQVASNRGRIYDPLNFVVTDDSGNILQAQTPFTATADATGGGIDWSNDQLTFDSGDSGDNAELAINVTPFSGDPSSLLLDVENGLVVDENQSGPLFDTLSLPSLGSSGSFSMPLPSTYSFDYDLSSFGDQEVNATADWSEAGVVEATPEPSSLALLCGSTVSGTVFLARRRRKPAVATQR